MTHDRARRMVAVGLLLLLNVGTWAATWPHAASAGAADTASIDAIVRAHMSGDAPPGLALAVTDGSEDAPRLFVYGRADIEQARSVSPASIFPIASITKTFTSIAVLELQQTGKLAISDALDNYLPDFPNARNITLHQLLVHTSGIADFTKLKPFLQAQAKDWTPQEILSLVAASPTEFPPGTRCSYNDSGYIILGLVIEKASGMSFADFVHERVAIPLGMTTAFPGSHSRVVPHRVAGYVMDEGKLRNAPYVSLQSPFAAGGIMAMVSDVVRLGQVLHRGGALISPQSYAAMIAPVPVSGDKPCVLPLPGASATYGYGLEIVTFDDLPGHRAIGKSGVFPGYSSYVARFEHSPLTIAAMANLDGSLPFTVRLVHDVAKSILARDEDP